MTRSKEMMNKHLRKRTLSMILAAVMVMGLFPTVSAADTGLRWELTDPVTLPDSGDRLIRDTTTEPLYEPTDTVRVSIVLAGVPTLRTGFASGNPAANPGALHYDRQLRLTQKTMENTISVQALEGKPLDVVWNLTLVSNIISANVPYGKIDAIRSVRGVRDVVIEQQYTPEVVRPDTAASSAMTGASAVWPTGLTGAGTRIAIIDTGTDTDHQSFDNAAYRYALEQNAAALGMAYADYTASLDLLDPAKIASVLEHLNACERIGADAEDFYINEKLPFGANYVDYNLTVDHDHDNQGSHGSHVAGIAAANRFIPQAGGFAGALETVFMTGVAPDAQIITLKVFGNAAGPYDSDYFAAIEDAIWLGCDSVNLSLGSGSPGFSANPLFRELLDYLATTNTVVVMSAGNSGAWADSSVPESLYDDGVSFHTAGVPGTYTNSLAVASVENDGSVGNYLEVADQIIAYTEGRGYYNDPIHSLDTSHDGSGTAYDYIFIDGVGRTSDYEGMDLSGKVVFCSRGEISFSEKASNAAKLGAAAVVIYNNDSGILGMDLQDYRLRTPCVSILRQHAAAVKAASVHQSTGAGPDYYTGSVTISRRTGVSVYGSDYYTLSGFSSWGVPGSLELKPEITAPGGNIWSVNGMDTSGTGYELMSGTSMAAPHITGMTALISEYIRANGLDLKTDLSVRHLAQSLLMSTAQPLKEAASGGEYYSILAQGAGLARVDLAVGAESYVLVDGMADGKVKVELGEDARREGVYDFSFSIHDLSGNGTSYQLRADLFTQDLFGGDDLAMHLDKQTRSLPVRVRFFRNGVSLEGPGSDFSCDLNGDGTTNGSDADHLLEYLMGNAGSLYADGDVNGDGEITSYDAHVLLTRLTGGWQVDVPAGGSVTVDVRLELPEGTRAILDSEYPTGAYLEGFVFAEPVCNGEGKLGVCHSIPLLGYYGSWTEPRMYDVGGYLEYLYGAELRTPYLYGVHGYKSNFVTVSKGGREEYLFGGNPYVQEDVYLPCRNAFNNRNGWMLNSLRFTPIRNARNSMILLENADTGERYLSEELGPVECAYFHVNAQTWQNTLQKLPLGLDLSGFPEGTRLKLSLITAPELYCTYDAATNTWITDWDALADGAYLSTDLTIDNTGPEILDVALVEDHILRITAKDNAYIAAAALLNASGSGVLESAAANQTEPGKEMTIDLDLSQVYGNEFLVALYDYAENQTVCRVELELKTQRPYFTAIDCSGRTGQYTGLDADGTSVMLATTEGRELPVAAAYAEGAVFEITEDGVLYVSFNEDLYSFTRLGALDPTGEWAISRFSDLAYNRLDGKLYTLFYSRNNNQAVPFLAELDPFSGSMTVLGQMPIDASTITIDGKGNFYSTIYGSSRLYRYTPDVVSTGKTTFIGQTGGYRSIDITSLAWDHNTDELYWAYHSGDANVLLKLDPATGAPAQICTLDFYARGLFIAYEPTSDVFAPTDQVLSVTMSTHSVDILTGTSVQLSAQVLPWNCSSQELIWASSDPAVASVDESGLVTGMSDGIAVITAASATDGSKIDSCAVVVSTLMEELKALVWDEMGQVSWSSFWTDNLPSYTRLAPVQDDLPLNATMIADGVLYASTLDLSNGTSDLYKVDPDTYELTPVGPSSAAYLDMDYSPSLGYGLAVYFDYVLLVDLQSGEYLFAWDWTGGDAADLVGISYYGTAYNSAYGADMDYFLLLDADGNVYLDAWISTSMGIGNFGSPSDCYISTIGAPVDTSYFQGFHYNGSYAYWTRFHEADNVVELIAWDCDGTGSSYSLGFFPEGVWPVGGLYTDDQFDTSMPLADHARLDTSVHTAVTPATALPAGSLNAAAVQSDEQALISIPLPVPSGAMEPTNGTLTVAFDPEALALQGVAGSTAAFAWKQTEDGKLSIAFADRTALPGGAVMAELIFRPLGTGQTAVTVSYGQWNQWHLAAQEEIPVELPAPTMPFTDVALDSFYYDPVLWAVHNGITTGTSETTFSPDEMCTRAQVVTFLWRANGRPEPSAVKNPFSDVKETEYYYKAVLWAVEMGITNGTSETTFSPDEACYRPQVVTFLWRSMGKPEPSGWNNPFADVNINDYYGPAVLWAVEQGITNGIDSSHFGVDMPCTRAHVVTFLYRTMN